MVLITGGAEAGGPTGRWNVVDGGAVSPEPLEESGRVRHGERSVS